MPKVSIVIVNFNGGGLTINCLKSLEHQSFNNFEIIILDNGSLDGSIIEIKNFLKNKTLGRSVKIICLNENKGFAYANLEGLKNSNGEFIALLNNDTEADKMWLEELVNCMQNYPNVGICASKLIIYGSDKIDSAGDGYSTLLKGFKRGEGENFELYDEKEYVFGACAGAALYRREMIEEIGFLDEDFFLIHEDTDLNFRAQLCGWKALYVPSAIVYHKVRSSIGKMSDLSIYFTLRNNEFVRIKNIPIRIFIRCLPDLLMGFFSEFYYFAIRHKKYNLYLRAKLDAIKLFPIMIRKRKKVMMKRRVNNKYLLNLMTPLWEKKFLKKKIQKMLYE